MNNPPSTLNPDLGKSKLLSSTLRPLTVVIPSSWSNAHKHKREPSIQSQSSSIQSPSWSILSFDQLSLYARRASNSSILLNVPGAFSPKNPSITSSLEDENKKRRLRDKIQQAIHGYSQTLLLSINDSSLGYYRISDHIHRKVPMIVDTRKRLNTLSSRIDTANSDLEDVRKDVAAIERLDSFLNIHQMIKKSLIIIKSNEKK